MAEFARHHGGSFEISRADKSFFYDWRSNDYYELRNNRNYKRKTQYKDDSLLTYRFETDLYDYGGGETSWNSNQIRRKYDNENRLIFEERLQQDQNNETTLSTHLSRNTYFYSEGNLIGQIEIVRNAVDTDTIYFSNDLVENIFNKAGLVVETSRTFSSSYEGNEPYTNRTKESFYYNEDGQRTSSEMRYWDQQGQNWILDNFSEYEYHSNGQIKQHQSRRQQGDNFFVSNAVYDEKGRLIYQQSEIQDADGQVIQSNGWSTYTIYEGNREGALWEAYDPAGNKEFAYQYYTQYNQERKPTKQNYYWWEFNEDPERSYKYVSELDFDYDQDGYLVETNQRRYTLDADSILSEDRHDGHWGRQVIYEEKN